MASCSRCHEPAVTLIRYSGQHLCRSHLLRYVEKRVKRDLRDQLEIPPEGVRVAVAVSGGKDSVVTLKLLRDTYRRDPRVELVAVTVDEGIAGYRPESLRIVRELTEAWDVPLREVSYRAMTGHDLDELVTMEADGWRPCGLCGVLRRRGVNALAREVDADVLATGHNLDDTAQSILMNVLRGDVARLARLGPHRQTREGLVPRILPLRSIPEREVALYAHLAGLPVHLDECPHSLDATRRYHRDLLLELEDREPGTRHRLVAGYDRLRDALAEVVPASELEACPNCGEPTSGGVCRACSMLADLGLDPPDVPDPAPVEAGAGGHA